MVLIQFENGHVDDTLLAAMLACIFLDTIVCLDMLTIFCTSFATLLLDSFYKLDDSECTKLMLNAYMLLNLTLSST